MKKLLLAGIAISLLVATSPAEARHHHRASLDANGNLAISWTESALGRIRVANDSFRNKIVGFIADVKARGFRGPIHCYASGGHVRGSLHYSGHACDFAQHGWGRTRAPMYHVADLARKWGLRDGCTFHDCGHIDSGGSLHRQHNFGHYYAARSHHRTRYVHVAYAEGPRDRFSISGQ